MKKKRGVLSLGLTLVLVFAGLFGVVGVTALTLYLMGRFEEVVVEPENIDVALNDCMGFELDDGQFFVANDFKMIITSTTENVTRKKVTLSLERKVEEKDGFISDGVIKVPKEVMIGQEFSVSLKREYNQDVGGNYIIGGTSKLTATSENVLIRPMTFTVAVDVPVDKIDVNVKAEDVDGQTGSIQTVVVGSRFDLDVKFNPAEAEYVFSNTSSKKEVFYDFSKSFIDFDWSTKHFVANKKSGNETDKITAYTFANSYYRKQVLDQYVDITDPEELNRAVVSFLSNPINSQACKSKELRIQVLEAKVESVTMQAENKLLRVVKDKYFTLTTASSRGDDTLGLSIKDSSGALLREMFGRVGIKVEALENFKILGGRVMKVEQTVGGAVITEEKFDEEKDYSPSENASYYILPDTQPQNSSDWNWRFVASENATADEMEFDINFFYEETDGRIVNFFDFQKNNQNSEKKIKISISTHDNEEEAVWEDSKSIDMVITYDSEGKPREAEKDLSADLKDIAAENVYKAVRYFIYADVKDVDSGTITNVFATKDAGRKYTSDFTGKPLSILDSVMPADGYMLYELDNAKLIAKQSLAKTVKVVAVTVRTYADGRTPYYNPDGSYQIVSISMPRAVTVISSISIQNIEPSFFFDESIKAGKDGNYFLPAINRDNSLSQKDIVKLELRINNVTDVEADKEKVLQAFRDKKLYVECLDMNGDKIEDFVTLKGLENPTEERRTLIFTGSLTINEALFEAMHKENANLLDMGTYIKLQLVYNDGKTDFTKAMTFRDDTATEFEQKLDHFYIYYQQPVGIEGVYSENGYLASNEIEIKISSENVTANWGTTPISGRNIPEIVDSLNKLLSFRLIDQYDNEIVSNTGIYSVRFVEETEDGQISDNKILGFDAKLEKLQTFGSTQGRTEHSYLKVYVADRKNNENLVPKLLDNDGTEQFLSSERFAFVITTEGITKVEKYYDENHSVNNIGKESFYVENENTSSVKIDLNVARNDEINLKELLKVFKGADGATSVDDFVVKLDSNYVADLTNKTDIMKMISFDGSTANTIEYYLNKSLTTMKILNSFNDPTGTKIKFTVSDVNATMFNIELEINLLKDISVVSNFNKYSTANSDLLVNDNFAAGVFGGAEYDLDEFSNFTSQTGRADLSWAKILEGVGDLNDLYSDTSGLSSLVKKEEKIYLKIKDVYNLQTSDLTIYYGTNSTLALQMQVKLFVNPNIIIKEEVPLISENAYIDLAKVDKTYTGDKVKDDKFLSTKFKFFKATDYINQNKTFEGLRELSLTDLGLSMDNTSKNKILNVKNQEFGFYNGAELKFKLGETFAQNFTLSREGIKIDAIKIKTDAKMAVIQKCEKDKLSLEITAGYGADASNIVLKKTTQKIGETEETLTEKTKVVKFNGDNCLLLTSEHHYIPAGNATFSDVTGFLSVSGKEILVSGNPLFSTVGNSLTVTATLTDEVSSQVTVAVNIKVIVSGVGEQFVYYNNSKSKPSSIKEMKFDTATMADGTEAELQTLLANAAALQEADVYQELKAGGVYIVLHDFTKLTNEDINSDNGVFGFYYNGTTSKVNQNFATINWEIVSGADLASKDKDGNLKINHLENSMQNKYIVLKCTIINSQSGSFEWFYRIKVVPSFTKGEVLYPYASNVEHLDTDSEFYDAKENKFTIDLNEQFNASTAKAELVGETRFENPIVEGATVESTYTIFKVMQNGVELTEFESLFTKMPRIEDGIFTVGLKNSKDNIAIEIIKTFFVNGDEMIGSQLVYRFQFNQRKDYYVHNLQAEKENPATITKKGDVYTTTINADGQTSYEFKTSISLNNITTPYKFYAIGGGTFTQGETTIQEIKFENGKLTICPEAVDADKVFEVGFYTEEKRVFKFLITVTNELNAIKGYLNSNFIGGKVYNFKTLSSSELGIFTIPTTSSYANAEIEIVDEIESVNLNGENEKYYLINADKTIEFAHLTEDAEFKFRAKVIFNKSGSEKPLNYNFDFTITVGKSFDVALTNNFDATSKILYGGDIVAVNMSEVADKIAKFKIPTENIAQFIIKGDNTFTVDNVENDVNGLEKIFKVIYSFNKNGLSSGNKDATVSFETNIHYIYAVRRNVSVKTVYPMPNGTKGEERSTSEFISTSLVGGEYQSKSFYGFFHNDKPDFSTTSRLEVEDIRDMETVPQNVTREDMLKYDFSISIANIDSNVLVYATVDGNQKIYTAETANKLIESKTDQVEFAPAVSNLGFALTKDETGNYSTQGTVRFEITINSYKTEYIVTIVRGSAVMAQFNQPNYSSISGSSLSAETVYAEDLKNQKSKQLFEQGRILQFAFNANLTNQTYYVRFSKTGESDEIFALPVGGTELVNFDLGKSLTGYEYKGVYTSKAYAQAGGSEGKRPESEVFKTSLRLTERIELVYFDGKPIIYTENNSEETTKKIQASFESYYFEYTFHENESKDLDKTYDVVYNKGEEEVKISVKADGTQNGKKINLSQNMDGYEFKGIYLNNIKIEFGHGGGPFVYALGKDYVSGETFEKSDYQNIKTLHVYIKYSDGYEVSAEKQYNLYLTTDFQVTGNADNPNSEEGFAYATVAAGTEKPLLSQFTAFGIKHTKGSAENYTQQDMTDAEGKFSLKIYGLGDMPISANTNDALTYNAFLMHEKLKTMGEDKNGVKILYSTGLTPRKGVLNDNGIVGSGQVTDNYVDITGVPSSSSDSDVDYTIRAQGSSNDGNFVMMKISYVVQIAEDFSVAEEHNIMFKVVSNSNISFKRDETGGLVSGDDSLIVNGHSVVSNIKTPYQITFKTGEETKQFNLWDVENGTGVVIANMYGKTENKAQYFTYQLNQRDSVGFNNWNYFNESFSIWNKSEENPKINEADWIGIEDPGREFYGSIYQGEPLSGERKTLSIHVPNLNLGEMNYYVDFENTYGFKCRFYFTIKSELNPQISGVGDTFKEGESLAIGARYTQVNTSIEKNNNNYTLTYQPFTYLQTGSDTNKIYNNILKFEGKTPQSVMISAVLQQNQDGVFEETGNNKKVNLEVGDVIYREITGSSSVGIFTTASNKDWKLRTSDDEVLEFDDVLQNGTLKDAQITIKVTYNKADSDTTNTLNKVKVLNTTQSTSTEGTYLTQVYTAGDLKAPDYGSGTDAVKGFVTLDGLDAYAFSKENYVLDETTAVGNDQQSFLSNIDQIKVERVDFYLGDTWLGSSLPNGGHGRIESETSTAKADLITSNDVQFVQKEGEKISWKDGAAFYKAEAKAVDNQNQNFEIPYINGIEFGKNGTLSNVKMKVKLVSGANSCTLETVIMLTRKETTSGLFNTDVSDGGKATQTGTQTILNDTLEVKLKPNESITFAVTKDDFDKVKITTKNEKDETAIIETDEYDLINGVPQVTWKEIVRVNETVTVTEFNKWTQEQQDAIVEKVLVEAPKGSTDVESYYQILKKRVTIQKPAKLVTLTNHRAYSVTEYVSITDSMVEGLLDKNLGQSDKFTIYVTEHSSKDGQDPNISYNGQSIVLTAKEIGEETDKQKVFTGAGNIGEYKNSIKFNIEHVNELNGSDHKTERLHFLLVTGNQTIQDANTILQLSENFNIYPNFKSATPKASETNEHGDLLIDKYYKMQGKNDAYYMVSLESWGENIDLTPYVGETKTTLKGEAQANSAYKFHFEINNTSAGAGSAFIDDNGLITTSKTFDPAYHTITINIYMKVSGFDGQFEDTNKTLNLVASKRIRLGLKQCEQFKSFSEAFENLPENIPLGTTILMYNDSENISSINKAGSNLFVVPSGYEVYQTYTKSSFEGFGSSTVTSPSKIEDIKNTNKTFAVNVGEKVDFHEMFKSFVQEENSVIKELANFKNLSYHLVKVGDEEIYYNNLNSYTFNNTGAYDITVVATGYTVSATSKTPTSAIFTTTLIVYGTSAQENKYVVTTTDSYSLSGVAENVDSWFELDKDGVVIDGTVNAGNVALDKGFSKRRFLATFNGTSTSKIYNVTFLRYDPSKDIVNKSVAINNKGSFTLANLIENPTQGSQYAFWFISEDGTQGIQYIEDKLPDQGVNAQATKTYYLVETRADASTEVKRFNVTYKVMPSTTEELSMFIPSTTFVENEGTENATEMTAISIAALAEKLKEIYKLNSNINFVSSEPESGNTGSYLMIQERSAKNVLTAFGRDGIIKVEKGVTTLKKDFLISFRATNGGSRQFKRISMTFYLYEQAKHDLTIYALQTSLFDLADINDQVRKAVGTTEAVSVTYYKLNENINLLERVTDVPFGVQQQITGEYYVKVGENYYLINLTLNAVSVDDVAASDWAPFADGKVTFEQGVYFVEQDGVFKSINEMNVQEGAEFVEVYKLNGRVMKKTKVYFIYNKEISVTLPEASGEKLQLSSLNSLIDSAQTNEFVYSTISSQPAEITEVDYGIAGSSINLLARAGNKTYNVVVKFTAAAR